MQSSDPAHLTPKKTSVFSNNLNAAIGSARLPPSQMLGDGIDDRENQNELFQQQAQAVSIYSFYVYDFFYLYLRYEVAIRRYHIQFHF